MPRVHTISGAAPVTFQAPSASSVPALYGLGQDQPLDFGARNQIARHATIIGLSALGAIGSTAILHGRSRGWATFGVGASAIAFGFIGNLVATRLIKPPPFKFPDLPNLPTATP